MPAADLIAFACLNLRVVQINIIQLKLHDLRLRIFREDLIEHLGGVVERDADVLYSALRFQLKGCLVGSAALEFLKNVLALRVHEIEVKILHAAGFELALKERTYVLLFIKIRACELIGEDIALSRAALHKALPYGCLALAAEVAVSRIEIIKPLCKEVIDHLAKFRKIHLVAVHRQTHTAEAEILLYIFKFTHVEAPFSRFAVQECAASILLHNVLPWQEIFLIF